jgi:4-amino-4-deoxychorismate lyase
MNACLINGQAINLLSVADRSIHYGDGVFETIALKTGVMPFWSSHYQRLAEGCDRLKISLPSEGVLLKEIDSLKQDMDRAVIKVIVTRGSGGRGYRPPQEIKSRRIVQCHPWPDYSIAYYQQGVRVIFCQTLVSENPVLAGIKHLNRLDSVLAASEWQSPDITEGFMCNAQGEVIQGTRSNIFCAREGVLYTPDLQQAGVKGVMRAQILNWAKQEDISVVVKPISRMELLLADEVFITNSIFGIWPVCAIEDKMFAVGPLSQRFLLHLG